ncbi:hypothetical protein BCR35DRAFT_311090 [Leucosporidium creatinivorum]|uniref:Uncharacterized protein n=1 Tax=Leucosporidium creatinivorum TaxID=106004 RepID=A0A1Y2CEF5_9BASI|nr:hypothetical protein BCR35DRAFT_311090 [Leucosporidium creatinivorum]
MLKLDLASLRPWLQLHLEPICDADPVVLSDYIVALLKHEVSIDDLKKLCQEQLEDFLGQETAPFITRLFFFLTTPPSLASMRAEPPQGPRGLKRPLDASASTSLAAQGKRPPPQFSAASQQGAPLGVHAMAPSGPQAGFNPAPRRGDPKASRAPRELCKDYHFRGFCARGAGCPYQHDEGASAAVPPLPFFSPFPAMPPYPSIPGRPAPPPFGAPPPPFPPPSAGGPPGRRRPNVPPYQGHDGRPLSTTTLAVENVPRDALTSTNVRQFFEQFGAVTSVAVDPPGLRALVTFATPDQAKRALTSPEAIFGNRFVRVYRAREAIADSTFPRPDSQSIAPSTTTENTRSSSPSSPTAGPAIHSSPPRRPTELPVKPSETATRAARMQENASAQKALMDQLDSLPGGSSSQRSSIMSALRKLSSEASTLANAAPPAPSPEERLASLRKEAAALGIDANAPSPHAPRGRGRGRAGYRGGSSTRGRGGLPRSFRLDNRVTKIVVGEVDPSAALPTLRSYFERFGEVLLLNPTAKPTEYVVEFKTRQAAEAALSKGSDLEGVGRVSLRWAPSTDQAVSSALEAPTRLEEQATDDSVMAEPPKDDGEAKETRSDGESSQLAIEEGWSGVEEDGERSWNR